MKNKFIYQKKKLLSKSLCDDFINAFERNPRVSPGQCGGQIVDRSKKQSLDLSLDLFERDHLIMILQKKISDEMNIMKEIKPFTSLEEIDGWSFYRYFNVQKYLPGWGFIRNHCEHGPVIGTETKHARRILAWMIYLNDVTDKGGTRFPNQNLTLKARAGDFYVWPAAWTHMHHGIPSPTQIKYIITGWVEYDNREFDIPPDIDI